MCERQFGPDVASWYWSVRPQIPEDDAMLLQTTHGSTYVDDRGGPGRPVLALHGGLGLSCGYLRDALAPYEDRLRVVYVDLLGNGESSRDLDPTTVRDNSLWVRQIHETIELLHLERPVLLGHSYGGVVALEFALAHPEVPADLVLASTTAQLAQGGDLYASARNRAGEEGVRAVERLLAGTVEDDDSWREIWREVAPLYFHRPDPEVLRRLDEVTSYSSIGFNASYAGAGPSYDVRDRLVEIDRRTWVVCGDDDWVVPADPCSRFLADRIPRATLTVYEDCGHFPMTEVPTFGDDLVDWAAQPL